jgi:hypothetical protein
MKVALQFDEPWEDTGHLAGKWWLGTLDTEGRVALDEPVPFKGYEGRLVRVHPRYVGDSLANLRDAQHIIVHQQLETAGGKFGLVGSIKQIGLWNRLWNCGLMSAMGGKLTLA